MSLSDSVSSPVRPGRRARPRKESRAVREIVRLLLAAGGDAAPDVGPCQRCGATLAFGAGRGQERLSTALHACDRCLEVFGPVRELRFCELCGRWSDAVSARSGHAVCGSCLARVPEGRLALALADAGARRFVDRVCPTSEGLRNLQDAFALLAFEQAFAGSDEAAARAAHRRHLRTLARSHRERGLAWTAPVPPEFDAPAAVRRLDVFVARVLRVATDPFAREAIVATPRDAYVADIRAVGRLPEEWSSRVEVSGASLCHGRHFLTVLRARDRLGRSAHVLLRARDWTSGGTPAVTRAFHSLEIPYELVDVYGTWEHATAAAARLVSEAESGPAPDRLAPAPEHAATTVTLQ